MKTIIGRQAIFDINESVYAYELLFRGGFNALIGEKENKATADVIQNTLFTIGFESLTAGKYAFINFTSDLILEKIPLLLPNQHIVVELLENIPPDQNIINACKELKDNGYMIALDDFVLHSDDFYNLFPFIDIIKIDFRETDVAERNDLVKKLEKFPIKLLAEKIETKEEYHEAKEIGCLLFQGYYFTHPDIVEGKEVGLISGHQNFELLKEISNQDLDFKKLENVIRIEPSLAFKLLRMVNSGDSEHKYRIKSILQAMTMLGVKKIRKWLYIILFKELSLNINREILSSTVIRANFCEKVSKLTELKDRSDEAFMLGMFSLLDVIISRSMEQIVIELPLESEIKSALCGEENNFKAILDLVIAYENANWVELDFVIKNLKIDENDVSDIYMESISNAYSLDL